MSNFSFSFFFVTRQMLFLVLQLVFTKVLFGLDKIDETKFSDDECKKALEYFKKVRDFKRSEDEKYIVNALNELQFSVDQIPSHLCKSQTVSFITE